MTRDNDEFREKVMLLAKKLLDNKGLFGPSKIDFLIDHIDQMENIMKNHRTFIEHELKEELEKAAADFCSKVVTNIKNQLGDHWCEQIGMNIKSYSK